MITNFTSFWPIVFLGFSVITLYLIRLTCQYKSRVEAQNLKLVNRFLEIGLINRLLGVLAKSRSSNIKSIADYIKEYFQLENVLIYDLKGDKIMYSQEYNSNQDLILQALKEKLPDILEMLDTAPIYSPMIKVDKQTQKRLHIIRVNNELHKIIISFIEGENIKLESEDVLFLSDAIKNIISIVFRVRQDTIA